MPWIALGLRMLTTLTLFGTPKSLRADTTSASGATEITSLPRTISQPGVYYLNQNFVLSTTGVNAITVQADGVTIDLNGHTISNVAAGNSVVDTGIYAPNAARLTVRNGTIRGFTNGFYAGGSSSYGDLIENVRFTDTTYAAVTMYASGSIIRHCQMFKIGGSTQPQYPCGVGVLIEGSDVTVLDCDISDLTDTNPSYQTQAIYLGPYSTSVIITGNRISTAQCGIYFDSGATGKYRDNLCAASVGTPYTGGTDVGNN